VRTPVWTQKERREQQRSQQAVGSTETWARELPLSWRSQWRLALVAVLVGAGLGLRLITVGQLPIHLDQWLPWVNPPTVTLYFPDAQGRFLVPVTRRMASENVTPEGAVRELLRGPKNPAGLRPVFPGGTRISRIDIQDGAALVEFTTASSERADWRLDALAHQAFVSTLKGLPGVESVRMLVNGTGVNGDSVIPAPKQNHPVYYTYGPYLVPVMVEASSPDEALHRYLEGPVPSGLAGLPADVRLLGYRLDTSRGLVRVNFTYTDSVHQLALANPDGIRRTLTGIIATLTGFPEVKAVMLDFEGHAQLGLGQCSDLLRAPQVRPSTLNDEQTIGF